MRKEQSPYSIDIYNLKNGQHQFEMQVDKALLEYFQSDVMEDVKAKVMLTVTKTETSLQVDIHIDGKVTLLCDRSLEAFDEPFEVDDTLYYKFGEAFEELDDNLFVIPENELQIDLAQALYDFIVLSLPAKRIHPDYRDEWDEDELLDEDYAIEIIYEGEKEDDSDDNDEGDDDDNDDIDPRWQDLKKLK
ncbi:DUF177 domain-containing protein [Algivirga pacifica]|uniref:DUF177 domain-containing protein n=1 Tax=Algivirga pacifica TaxID=1162670 RepID=A0ABP9DR68_9BACT